MLTPECSISAGDPLLAVAVLQHSVSNDVRIERHPSHQRLANGRPSGMNSLRLVHKFDPLLDAGQQLLPHGAQPLGLRHAQRAQWQELLL